MYLTLRTDKPKAEIGLYNSIDQIRYERWLADRQLAETIHYKIIDVLKQSNATLQDLTGIVVYQGPGSFTGLRIGISVANALAYGLGIAIVGSQSADWLESGLERLHNGANEKLVVPVYGAEPHTTVQKK